jgi:hypothetical protein
METANKLRFIPEEKLKRIIDTGTDFEKSLEPLVRENNEEIRTVARELDRLLNKIERELENR